MSTNQNSTDSFSSSENQDQTAGILAWFNSAEAKNAQERSVQGENAIHEIIEKMSMVDPEEIKKPYTI